MKVPLIVGFLALLFLLVADGVMTNQTFAQLQRDQRRITDLQAERLELEARLLLYADAETGQQGFIVTGDEKFLEPYEAARAQLNAGGLRLKAVLGSDRRLAAMDAEIRALGEQRMRELDVLIQQRRSSDVTAIATRVQDGEGQRIMDEIRRVAAEIDHQKVGEVKRVLAEAEQTKKWAGIFSIGSDLVLGAALAALFFFSRAHLRERDAAKNALSQSLAAERVAHSEAALANKLKDEFLALVSHELRTPLNAMLGWTSLLKEGADDAAELTEGLETIDRNARAQARLVDDLLDVSRIVSGKLRLVIAEVDLRGIVASVIDTLRPAAMARGVAVKFHAIRETADVLGDSDRLQQVVWNLLSNAIKFTPRGGQVTLSLERTDSRVGLEVADSGAGIRADFLPRIFDRFSQGDSSTTRGHSGLGLGLAISRHLVEMHGGSIDVRSDGEGKGATFRIEIPVVAVKELKEQMAQHPDEPTSISTAPPVGTDARVEGRRVLAVDDQQDSLTVTNRVLTRAGAEVRTATSAAEALSILSDWLPDIIVSDIGMPGQDGYTFIRAVRALPRLGISCVPAVALSAFARESDRKAAIDAGFDDHLAKPVEAVVLLQKVAELLART